MERESRKRARDQGEDKKESSGMSNTAKKQYLSSNNNGMSLEEDSSKTLSDNYLGLGVFDFPWLKEGMISKSDDWKFEDTFSSSLSSANGLEFYGQNLCQTPVPLMDFPEDDNGRFDHHAVVDGDEGVDCIWSSLLNQPLEPGVFN